jgi:hypothetical protein
VLDEPPFTVVPMHAAGKRLPGHGVVLDEHFELQARPEDRGDDLAQPMAPLPELVVAKLDFGVDVRFGLVEMSRFRLLEIRVAQHPFVCPLVIEGQQNRMSLTQEKPATGAQQVRDGPCPSPNIRQPAQCTDPGEDEVESTADGSRSAVDVRLDKGDVGTGVGGNATRDRDRFRREVEACHRGAEAVQ